VGRNSISVLVVDDADESWVKGLIDHLSEDRNTTFVCKRAMSVDEAKEAFLSRMFDAVVLDLKLDGEKPSKELLEWIPGRSRHTVIILVTDEPGVPIPAGWMAFRGDAFFCKSDAGAFEEVKSCIVHLTAEKRQLTVNDIADSLALWGRMHGKERIVLKCGGESYTAEQLAQQMKDGTSIGKDFQSAILERLVTGISSANGGGGAIGEDAKAIVRERMEAFMGVLAQYEPR
jgi:hypothetical protein